MTIGDIATDHSSALCPDEEGIKTLWEVDPRTVGAVQHSALTKKGLRRDGLAEDTAPLGGSALCPDEEGIKTARRVDPEKEAHVQHSALTKKGLRQAPITKIFRLRGFSTLP